MNLFDHSTLYTAIWPVEKFAQTAQDAGYQGLEVHPLQTIRAGIQLQTGILNQKEKNAIRSLHQSPRSEKSLSDVLKHPNRTLAAVFYLILPERVRSLHTLERIQQAVGRNLPVVLYPHRPGEASGTEKAFGEKLFQPTPEIMASWGTKNIDDLILAMQQKGYDGFCLDLYHMRRSGNPSLLPWQQTLSRLLPYTKEIHVSAGRIDIHEDIDTLAELRDLLDGTRKTELIPMLEAVKSAEWKGRIVTEIPAGGLRQVLGQGNTLSPKELVNQHKKIVTTIQRIFA